ncbi:Sedlin [Pavlovales sp. CCMP2436]|nr:Sedlin [Pavlovales sp. CCMP2436]|mmetsp:Transcript_33293/g.76801  ORF Transcript_33293/g.76801 Transcript_33293/m.76801 type:complete len:149 (+) Transcript_33293:136-582(+)
MTSAEPRARLLSAAVVSRANRPLFLGCLATGMDELRLSHVVHSSLDIFDERRAVPTPPGTPVDPYLGLLQPAVDFRVYGYMTSSETKMILVMSDGDIKEPELRQLFRRLHALVVDAFSNPFYVAGNMIASKKFDAGVRQLAVAALPER